jgi:drug/metabolite transporter, DME family
MEVAPLRTGLSLAEASVLLLLEPVLDPVWSWAIHGEIPGTAALVGGAFDLGATMARAWWSEERKGLTETLSPH